MVELERMDWENVKEKCNELIRSAILQKRQGELMLKEAEKELKKFPEDDKTPSS